MKRARRDDFPTRADPPRPPIIAGSREITNYEAVRPVIESCPWRISEVVSGGARGVDLLGERWAHEHRIPVKRFDADWKTHGDKAGPLRNREMAEYVKSREPRGGVILIWHGDSKGTGDMLIVSIFAGIWIHEMRYPKPPPIV